MLLVQGQLLLFDGVIDYFPSPIEASNSALDQSKNGEKVPDSKQLYPLLSFQNKYVMFGYIKFTLLLLVWLHHILV